MFRLALEKGPAGKNWHAVADEAIPFREIAEAIGSRLGLPAVSIPADVLMLPGYFGFLANLVTLDLPASLSPACSPIWTTVITSLPAELR